MSPVKGTPAYWKKFMKDFMAMIKQLGIPTFFSTFSCDDLRWNELASIISKINGMEIPDEEISKINYRSDVTYSTVIRCWLQSIFSIVWSFYKIIVLDGSLAKKNYYATRIELKIRRSPHILLFIWILNAPTPSQETKEEYISWLDKITHADLSDFKQEA